MKPARSPLPLLLTGILLSVLFLGIFLSGMLAGKLIRLPGLFSFLPAFPGITDDGLSGGTAAPRVIVTRDSVVEQVRIAAKFVSVEYHMADFITWRDERRWPFSDRKILALAKAKVLAGFDLRRNFSVTVHTGENPEENGTTVLIDLPRPEILAVEPDIRFHEISGNPPREDLERIIHQAHILLKKNAIQAGILRRAKESLRVQLETLYPGAALRLRFQGEAEDGNARK